MEKIKVAVIFGGRSGEHEVSLVSATSIIQSLDKEKYSYLEIGIDLNGQWYTGENCLQNFKEKKFEDLKKVSLSLDPSMPGIVHEDGKMEKVDIAFPVLHGPFGEDGTIQGLFEMGNLPYVGCNVLASSTAMDKLQCKAIWEAFGLPVVPYIGFTRNEWEKRQTKLIEDIKNKIGLPCFVKPVNMGSSVGITKVKNWEELISAIELAARFDKRILVEKGINAREIECAVLGNDEPIASPVGEVIVAGEFYDFYDKYVNGKSSTKIPADLEDKTSKQIQENSLKAFKLLDCSGLARVDSFVDRESGEIYLNEINTMPGFTSISMYPKMIEAYGIKYPELIDRLLTLGLERYADRQKNQIVFNSESDWFKK